MRKWKKQRRGIVPNTNATVTQFGCCLATACGLTLAGAVSAESPLAGNSISQAPVPKLVRTARPVSVDELRDAPSPAQARLESPTPTAEEMRRLLHPAGSLPGAASVPGAPKINRFVELSQPEPTAVSPKPTQSTPSALVTPRRSTRRGTVRRNPMIAAVPPTLRRFSAEETAEPRRRNGTDGSLPAIPVSSRSSSRAIDQLGSHLEPAPVEEPTAPFINDQVSITRESSAFRDQLDSIDEQQLREKIDAAIAKTSPSVNQPIPTLPPPRESAGASQTGVPKDVGAEHIARRSENARELATGTLELIPSEAFLQNTKTSGLPSPYRASATEVAPMEIGELIASEAAKKGNTPRQIEEPKKSFAKKFSNWKKQFTRSSEKPSSKPTTRKPKGGLLGPLFQKR
ncbi:MAG: hypothetical protein AAFV88_08195 [Planctomycetota bacterium]